MTFDSMCENCGCNEHDIRLLELLSYENLTTKDLCYIFHVKYETLKQMFRTHRIIKPMPYISINSRKKRSISKLCEKNNMWKGDKVGLFALHNWIRRRKPKPQYCVACNKNYPIDLANISGEYKRDVDDYEWLCRSCHMKKEGRGFTKNHHSMTPFKRPKSYAKRYRIRPELCEVCNVKRSNELKNITKINTLDINNFRWVCRGCSMKLDGRMQKLNDINGRFTKRRLS